MIEVTLAASMSEELRLLDERGCLTLGAMGFIDQLDEPQHMAVRRHLKDCDICAQQHASVVTAVERIRRSRPRVAVPVEASLVARQAILRGLRTARRRRIDGPPGGGRYLTMAWTLRFSLLAGAILAILAAMTGLIAALLVR